MQLFDNTEVDSDNKTFDPNTLNKKIQIQAMLDVDMLHEADEDEILEEVKNFVNKLKSQTKPTP